MRRDPGPVRAPRARAVARQPPAARRDPRPRRRHRPRPLRGLPDARDRRRARAGAARSRTTSIVFQHPFYWYSTPAILKEWQDLVLEHGWAYGAGGTAAARQDHAERDHHRRPGERVPPRRLQPLHACASCSRRGIRPRTCAACGSSRRSSCTRRSRVDRRRRRRARRDGLPPAARGAARRPDRSRSRRARAQNLADELDGVLAPREVA